jgi:hypothetical protein
LVQLANIDRIEAYRTLEKYVQVSTDQLRDWATLAWQECRLLLESKLLTKARCSFQPDWRKRPEASLFYNFLIVNGRPYSSFEQKILTDKPVFSLKIER